jgi:hypothetical protein
MWRPKKPGDKPEKPLSQEVIALGKKWEQENKVVQDANILFSFLQMRNRHDAVLYIESHLINLSSGVGEAFRIAIERLKKEEG